MPLFESDYVRESIDFLRENLSGRQTLVCISGGKDSICIEHLMKLTGLPYILQSTLTGIDAPCMISFIRKQYPACQFVRPRQSFWHLLTTHNPPGGTGRGIKWCCTKIKENPCLLRRRGPTDSSYLPRHGRGQGIGNAQTRKCNGQLQRPVARGMWRRG